MEISEILVVFLSQDSGTGMASNKLREEASNVNMHETKAITVTEVIKRERLGNWSGARHFRAWIHLYITRVTEEE
jgi:hypothetical protein